MNTACAEVAGGTRPGDLLRLVAEDLSGTGLDVIRSGAGGWSQIAIACRDGQCALSVSDCGNARWDYWPAGEADPGLTADLAAILLTGHPGACPPPQRDPGRQDLTFKAVVGLDLRARGLDVKLAVYPDKEVLDAYAEIVITSPADTRGDMQVWASDDGHLTWRRDYQPGGPAVAAIVATAKRAISRLHAAGQPA